ncbi:MAG: hypothetical protein K2I05_00710 [Mailhella sp.]|nr:hypothetical protein [Mailhella sp.]
MKGRKITLMLKFADFKQITRQLTLEKRTNATDTIFENACILLDELSFSKAVRLIGIGVSCFDDDKKNKQLSLLAFADKQEEQRENLEIRRSHLDAALDTLRERYGKSAVVRGKLFVKTDKDC